MSKTTKVWTMNDLENAPMGVRLNGETSPGTSLKCCAIPSLPNADQAKAMIERVVREFEPIVKEKGYNVISVSELCCCNDGLDFEPTASGGKRRKLRKMANNIWGYNRTSSNHGGKVHDIHLRLRHPTSHGRFLPYEDVAGTMAHELAHCEHGPHNDKFYKLMDEILERHAVLMASNLTTGGGHAMPAFGGDGQRLGGTHPSRRHNNNTNPMLAAALGRQQKASANPTAATGYKLGGETAFQQWMTPAEAALVAAEARRRQAQLRLRGDHCCRPCFDDDPNEVQVVEQDSTVNKTPKNNLLSNQHDDRKPAARPSKRAQTQNQENRKVSAPSHDRSKSKKPKQDANTTNAANPICVDLTNDNDVPSTRASAATHWSCDRCTFRNQQGALACSMCGAETKRESFTSSSASHQLPLVPWSCSRCTFQNASQATSCSVCELPRS